jgi:Family of unknown function (DUF6516)
LPKAEKIVDVRNAFDDGSFLIIRVWRVVDPVPPSAHRFKYSFFYGRPGERLVLFDNERGKGDHKHIGDVESSYAFESVEKLTADFMAEVGRIRSRGNR